jgi:hypothetical protein
MLPGLLSSTRDRSRVAMATKTMSPVAANHNYKLSYLLCAAESAANLQRDLCATKPETYNVDIEIAI